MGRELALAVVLLFATGGCDGPRRRGCPEGQLPCGSGCRPAGAVCCDDGTRKTSNFCTNEAGGGCFKNTRACIDANAGGAADFCCSTNGTSGSHDCPSGQRHCGLLCVPESQACCSGAQCTSFGENDLCPRRPGSTFCGSYDGGCHSCPAGSCCAGDFTSGPGRCVVGDVCTGSGSGGGGGSGDGCPTSSQMAEFCAPAHAEIITMPSTCRCPAGYPDDGVDGNWRFCRCP